MVKALGKDPLFKQAFDFIAVSERRGKSMYYNAKLNSCFVFVLKRLNLVKRLTDPNSRVDRMWERLTEIALFLRSKKHQAPAEILKAFIKAGSVPNEPLSNKEIRKLRNAFTFLTAAYRQEPDLLASKLATDQPQFYTLITLLLSTSVLDKFDHEDLARRLAAIGNMIDKNIRTPSELKKPMKEYQELAAKQTTHPARRERRQDILRDMIDAVEGKKKQEVEAA